MKNFEYASPTTEAEVLEHLRDWPGETELLAGGTDLVGLLQKMVITPKRVINLLRPRKLVRLPIIFHSYELLALIAVATFVLRTPFLIGLLTGYVLHLTLDLVRHHHEFRSPLFYLLTYRLRWGFRRDQLIKSEYL